MKHRSDIQAGFTLAELLVASVILSLVLSGVYFTFSSSIRLWRNGESDLQTYQDARTSMTIMTRELLQLLEGAGHLIEGDDNEIEFFAVAPPMHVGDLDGPRVLKIRYRTRPDADHEGRTLVREERLVESPMPARPPEEGEIDDSVVKLGRGRVFELAYGVLDFEITYLWVEETDEEADPLGEDESETVFKVHHLDEHRQGDGIPQAIRIALTLADANAEDGSTTFTTYAVFQGPTDAYEGIGLKEES